MANLSDVIYKMIDNAHPVGSYYLTETDTNPSAILHVGTWVQLKDRMLIGCGDSFAISSEGGEKEHTLTVVEMPNHHHSIYSGYDAEIISNSSDAYRYQRWANSNRGWHSTNNLGTSSDGGSQAHNNMPPYHTCYIWRRTA